MVTKIGGIHIEDELFEIFLSSRNEVHYRMYHKLSNLAGVICCEVGRASRDIPTMVDEEYDFLGWANDQSRLWAPLLPDPGKMALFHDLRRFGYIAHELPVVMHDGRFLSEVDFRRYLRSASTIRIIHGPITMPGDLREFWDVKLDTITEGIIVPGAFPQTAEFAERRASKIDGYTDDKNIQLRMSDYMLWIICSVWRISARSLFSSLRHERKSKQSRCQSSMEVESTEGGKMKMKVFDVHRR